MKKLFLSILVITFCQSLLAQQLYTLPKGTQSRVGSMENPNGLKGSGGQTNKGGKGNACAPLRAGQTLTLLNVSGSGIIQRSWFTIWDRSPEMLRGIRLRMYWDGQKTPAVDVPLGDFFCLGLGQRAAFENALFSTAEGRSFNCYIPMPFRKGARVTVTNETPKDQIMFFFDIDFIKKKVPDMSALYFHASWSRQNKRPVPEDVDLLPEIKGRGRFLGVSVGLNADTAYGDTWWGEGEVKMFIDGDKRYPTINGTGSEDYIGSGWSEGVFVNRYQGCLLADNKNGKFSFYRFHIPDEIVFNHDFRATLQQLGGGPLSTVKALQAKGIPLRMVNITNPPQFVGLLDSKDPQADLAKASPNDWICFNRSDDYAVTAYYYLDKP
jgi:hypothetical protein